MNEGQLFYYLGSFLAVLSLIVLSKFLGGYKITAFSSANDARNIFEERFPEIVLGETEITKDQKGALALGSSPSGSCIILGLARGDGYILRYLSGPALLDLSFTTKQCTYSPSDIGTPTQYLNFETDLAAFQSVVQHYKTEATGEAA